MAHRLFTAAIVVTLLAPRVSAHACSCRAITASRVSLPAEGTNGFPVGGVLRVFTRAFPAALHDELAREYRLVDAGGGNVPLDATWIGARLDLRPRTPLRPHARYTLERIFTYAPDGAQVSDARRLDLLRDDDAGLRRVWFPETRFETAGDATPPRAQGRVTLIDAQASVRYGGGDCGPGVGVSVDYALPANTRATDFVQFEVRGRGLAPMLVQSLPSDGSTLAIAGDLLCTPDPVTIPYRPPLSARIVVLDATGATVAASPWTIAHGTPRTPPPPTWASARAVEAPSEDFFAALRHGWNAPPIVTAAAATPASPAACPFGFETTARHEASTSGGREGYNDRATLLVDAHRGWIAVGEGAERDDTRLYAVDPDATAHPVGPVIPGVVTAATLLDNAPLVVTQTATAPEVRQTTLRAITPEGSPRWTVPLPARSRGHHVAVGDRQVLVVWESVRDASASHLAWRRFDAQTGAALGAAHETTHNVDEDGPPLAAWTGDRFLIAWTAPRALGQSRTVVQVASLTTRDALDTPRTLDFDAAGALDLVAAGDGAALVAAHEGVVRWALLDRDGAVVRGPVVVNQGVADGSDRKPRVTARDGLFTVTWESLLNNALWAAAVDRQGNVSPAHRVSMMRGGTTGIVMEGAGHSFLATYTVDHRRAWVSALRCRTATSPGAPQHVAPVPTPPRRPPL